MWVLFMSLQFRVYRLLALGDVTWLGKPVLDLQALVRDPKKRKVCRH